MFAQALTTARRYSQFVQQNLERYPSLLSEADMASLPIGKMREQAQLYLSQATDLAMFMKQIRAYRRFQMVRIAVRDLAQLAGVDETLRDASELADVLVSLTYEWVYKQLAIRWGTPVGGHSGKVQQLIVLGMGKLGGYELNYSSDIDLIFVFPEKGETVGVEQSISNDEFFSKVGQQLNQILNNVTEDGFVFRVDMRLRPFGSAGQLVHNFDAFEQYYQLHGRPWERYAMIKARAMTGNPEDVAELEQILRPFIYRRYVDFSMLASMRDLKRMIALEVNKKGADRDIKLGKGGIREIEFIAQAFQLVHGGQDARLRGRALMPILQILGERHYLDEEVVVKLFAAYRFLRAVENRLQMWWDQQTHLLPTETARMALLAESMQFQTVDDFLSTLTMHRDFVAQQFSQVLGEDKVVDEGDGWSELWQSPETATLAKVDDEVGWRSQLVDMLGSRKVMLLSNEARDRLNGVMPLLIAEVVATASGDLQVLKRIISVVKAILNRSAYLVLLRESAQARSNLVQLCAASPWLTEYIVQQPALLDQLLDTRELYAPLSKAALDEELRHQLVDVEDEERFMEALRRFKHAQVFKVAASDIMGKLPLMKVSDYLTWIAEVIVSHALNRAWSIMVEKHGKPSGMSSDRIPMVIVGFGKLGGLELGYGSDLDMVYLSDEQLDPQAMTEGARPIDNTVFFARLGQKLSSLLTTNVLSGVAYDVDMQLRPHGASGVLVPTLAGFFRYEREQAWIWEHQALIRTRAIAGDPALMARFEQERVAFLSRPRDVATLKEAVVSMRHKMRKNLDKSTEHSMDLKQGAGGIIDIEFMVQFWVLQHAARYPELLTYSDNMRQITTMIALGILSEAHGEVLMRAYQHYRSLGHRYALAQRSVEHIELTQVQPCREQVIALWNKTFSE